MGEDQGTESEHIHWVAIALAWGISTMAALVLSQPKPAYAKVVEGHYFCFTDYMAGIQQEFEGSTPVVGHFTPAPTDERFSVIITSVLDRLKRPLSPDNSTDKYLRKQLEDMYSIDSRTYIAEFSDRFFCHNCLPDKNNILGDNIAVGRKFDIDPHDEAPNVFHHLNGDAVLFWMAYDLTFTAFISTGKANMVRSYVLSGRCQLGAQ
jgi:hypothetical protein